MHVSWCSEYHATVVHPRVASRMLLPMHRFVVTTPCSATRCSLRNVAFWDRGPNSGPTSFGLEATYACGNAVVRRRSGYAGLVGSRGRGSGGAIAGHDGGRHRGWGDHPVAVRLQQHHAYRRAGGCGTRGAVLPAPVRQLLRDAIGHGRAAALVLLDVE